MIQVVNIFLVIIGIWIMFRKSVSLTSKSELRRPRTLVFGLLLIVAVVISKILSEIFKGPLDSYGNPIFTTGWFLAYSLPLLIPFIVVVFLKQPKVISKI